MYAYIFSILSCLCTYSLRSSGNTHDRSADGRAKSWNEARGERYVRKSIVGLDRILPKVSSVNPLLIPLIQR